MQGLDIWHGHNHVRIKFSGDPASNFPAELIFFLTPFIKVSESDLNLRNRISIHVFLILKFLDIKNRGSIPKTVLIATRKLLVNFQVESFIPLIGVFAGRSDIFRVSWNSGVHRFLTSQEWDQQVTLIVTKDYFGGSPSLNVFGRVLLTLGRLESANRVNVVSNFNIHAPLYILSNHHVLLLLAETINPFDFVAIHILRGDLVSHWRVVREVSVERSILFHQCLDCLTHLYIFHQGDIIVH